MSKPPATLRLDRLLANLGYGSRREIEAMARRGRISLDSAPQIEADRRIEIGAGLTERLMIDGEPVDPPPGLVLMVHKPCGVTCSHKEAGPLVYGLLPERWQRRDPALSTVGRLDKATSGLLLMTDDGGLLHRVIAPKSHVAKRYRATLVHPLRADAAAIFASGTLMLDGETKPLMTARLERHGPTEASVTVTEGRYHQVRRMFAALGNHVLGLHREAVGGLGLPSDLAPGAYRVLSAPEIAAIFAAPTVASPAASQSEGSDS
ncbi:MAG TPA: pseudouridine synthase [Lichenihabitans sp.]|nr:pseudouridine synthase [Lichenihabitans sp.]